jgi:hypothetical protein
MKPVRRFALGLALPALTLALPPGAAYGGPGRALADAELDQVHATGLDDATLLAAALGHLGSADRAVTPPPRQDLTTELERQQLLAQIKLAAASTQGAASLVQSASLVTLFTPAAPLFIPVLALPFPFFMLPPKPSEPGH